MSIDRCVVGSLLLILALTGAPSLAQSDASPASAAPDRGEPGPDGEPVLAEKPGDKLDKEKEKPKLELKAWIGYGDESNYGVPSGFSVPVTVHIDNPDEGFSGELVLQCTVFLDTGSYDDDRKLVVETSRPMEIGTSQQRFFTVTSLLPEKGTLDRCRVWLYADNGKQLDVLVQQAPVLLGRGSATMLVLGEDRKLFSAKMLEAEAEDPGWADVQSRTPWTSSATDDTGELDSSVMASSVMGSRLFNFFYANARTFPARASSLTSMRAVMVYRRAADPNNFDSAHMEAIADYVMSGGNLIVVPASMPDLYSNPPLRDMLPVHGAEAVSDLVLPTELLPKELRQRTNLQPKPGLRLPQYPVGHEREGEFRVLPGARVLLEGPDQDPLVVKGAYGLGHVYWFAYDVSDRSVSYETLKRLRGWLSEVHDSSVRRYLESLRKVDVEKVGFKLEAPPRREILKFLGLYIMLLVPINYLVFSFLGRRELAWLIVPVLAVGFAYYYYAQGFLTRLGFLSTYQHGAVMMMAGSEESTTTRARVLGTMVLYSPNNNSDIQVSFDNADMGFGLDIDDVRERGVATLEQKFREEAGGRVLENLSIKAKAARALRFDGYVDLKGSIRCDAQFDGTGRCRVRITNMLEGMSIHGKTEIIFDELSGDLEEVHSNPKLEVFRGARGQNPPGPDLAVGEIAPGETVEIVVDPSEYPGAGDLSILLAGELREPILEPTINGKKRQSQGARYRIFMRVW